MRRERERKRERERGEEEDVGSGSVRVRTRIRTTRAVLTRKPQRVSLAEKRRSLPEEERHRLAAEFGRFPNSLLSFYAVYDGHGGKKVADLCAKMVHTHFTEIPETPSPRVCQLANGDLTGALRETFVGVDQRILKVYQRVVDKKKSKLEEKMQKRAKSKGGGEWCRQGRKRRGNSSSG